MFLWHGNLAPSLVNYLTAAGARQQNNLISYKLRRVVAFRFPYECYVGEATTFIAVPHDLNLTATLRRGIIQTKVLIYVIRGYIAAPTAAPFFVRGGVAVPTPPPAEWQDLAVAVNDRESTARFFEEIGGAVWRDIIIDCFAPPADDTALAPLAFNRGGVTLTAVEPSDVDAADFVQL